MIGFSARVGIGCVVAGFLASSAMRAASPAPPTYRCQGFDEPIRQDMQIAKGRVLPLRGKLLLPGGTFGDQTTIKAPPALTLKFLPESGPEVDKTAGIEVRDYGKGNRFVWDDEAHWKFDLGSKSLEDDGKYRATLISGDEAEYRVDPSCSVTFNLRSK